MELLRIQILTDRISGIRTRATQMLTYKFVEICSTPFNHCATAAELIHMPQISQHNQSTHLSIGPLQIWQNLLEILGFIHQICRSDSTFSKERVCVINLFINATKTCNVYKSMSINIVAFVSNNTTISLPFPLATMLPLIFCQHLLREASITRVAASR